MSNWLSSPKVRLALLINGLYVISLLLPSPTQNHVRRSALHAYGSTVDRAVRRPPIRVSLPPAAGPTKAASYRGQGGGDLTIYLEKDLTMSGARGSRLQLSPTFIVPEYEDSPNSVLLRFLSFSDEPLFSAGANLVISADGRQVWPAYGYDGEPVWEGWAEDQFPPHATPAEQGGVVENVGKAIPYEVFADVIRAKRVVFNLGPHLVELNAGQMEALRDMHRLMARLRA
jgi:hypothetical protein